jgi:hypothetical protein
VILGSAFFIIATISVFTFLDLKNRAVPRKYIDIVFLISLMLYIIYDFLILETVAIYEILFGAVCFCLCYLFLTPCVMYKIFGPADVRIFSRIVFLTPVYSISVIGTGLIPPIDLFLNLIVLFIPTLILFKFIDSSRPAPALVAVSLSGVITMICGNLLFTLYDFVY